MRDRAPRREIHFDTIETQPEFNYVPKKARDPRRIELFTGRPAGYVIASAQKIGTEASAGAFAIISEGSSNLELRELADVLSVAAVGTAYHTFATPKKHDLMYRKIQLPEMVDPKSKERTTQATLITRAQKGLASAAEIAEEIEELVRNERDTSKHNEILGRALATTGFTLAVIHDQTARLQDTEEGMQWAAWMASRAASTRALELTGAVGSRPTMAQLADDQSPLRRYMNDHQEFISPPVYGVLLEEVGQSLVVEYQRQAELKQRGPNDPTFLF